MNKIDTIASGVFTIRKFNSEEDLKADKPFDVESYKNSYTNLGGQFILDRIIGNTGTVFNNANSFMGVSSTIAATVPTMLDLQGAVKVMRPMDAGFPARVGQVLTFKSTFGLLEANFSWQELAIFNGNDANKLMLARKSGDMGVKVASAIWEMTYTLTIP